jgi:uncharacterized membrane protein (UPF0127 family)
MAHVLLNNESRPLANPLQLNWCDTFLSRFRGLMLRPSLSPNEGIIMVQPVEDRINAAIHMFFMNFDIAVVWLDHDYRVVDAQYARRWRPAYTPARAAKYVIELHPNRLNDFHMGDQLVMHHV